MKNRYLFFGVSALGAAATVGACQYPQQQCNVAVPSNVLSTGSHGSTFELKPGQDATTPCAQLTAQAVGLQKVYPRGQFETGALAIRPAVTGGVIRAMGMMGRADADPNTRDYAQGDFVANEPGADNFCDVPTLTPAVLDFPAAGANPATKHTWEWSNVRVYNTFNIPGTQFVADLKYSIDGCSAEYKVKGVWPLVSCEDDDGNPDDRLCLGAGDPAAGIARSGINPSYPVKCDPVGLICVLNGEVPAEQ